MSPYVEHEKLINYKFDVFIYHCQQLGSLLNKNLKDDSGGKSKSEFIETVLVHLKEHRFGSASCLKFCTCGRGLNVNNEERFELQQKQLEVKMLFTNLRI